MLFVRSCGVGAKEALWSAGGSQGDELVWAHLHQGPGPPKAAGGDSSHRTPVPHTQVRVGGDAPRAWAQEAGTEPGPLTPHHAGQHRTQRFLTSSPLRGRTIEPPNVPPCAYVGGPGLLGAGGLVTDPEGPRGAGAVCRPRGGRLPPPLGALSAAPSKRGAARDGAQTDANLRLPGLRGGPRPSTVRGSRSYEPAPKPVATPSVRRLICEGSRTFPNTETHQ